MTPSYVNFNFGSTYNVSAFWGPRAETPDALAARWIALIDRLKLIDSALENWYDWQGDLLVPFDPSLARVGEVIAAGVCKGEYGEPEPEHGYKCSAQNTCDLHRGPSNIRAHMFAGTASPYSLNVVTLGTDEHEVPDPKILTFRIWQGMVLAVGECFEAAQVIAYPSSLLNFRKQPGRWQPMFNVAWISYAGPRFAPLITPPPSAVVERRPDGGLLMAATKDTFVADNPAHMAVARDIEAGCTQFNDAPWPPKDV